MLARSPALLRPGGTLVTTKAAAQLPASRDDIRQVVFVQESNLAQLIELARLVDQGHLRPHAGAAYPLARAAEAYSAKAAGGIPGRIILQPSATSCPARPSIRPPTCRSASRGSADPLERLVDTPRHNMGQRDQIYRYSAARRANPGSQVPAPIGGSRVLTVTSDRHAALP